MTSWLLVTFAVLMLLSVRDWTMWAPGCARCGARRPDRHAKDCPMKEDE